MLKRWPTLLSVFTALLAVATVTLHFIGTTRHRQYLRHWAIEADLFPKSAEWILVNGYYGVVDRLITFFITIMSNPTAWALSAVALVFYAFVLTFPTGRSSGAPAAWLMRQPEWRRRLIRLSFFAIVFMAMVPIMVAFVVAFMAVPAALGEGAGEDAAVKTMADFRAGCAASKRPCVQLLRDEKPVAQGYVLDTSSSHVAVFDVGLQRARVLPLEGIEILTVRPQQ